MFKTPFKNQKFYSQWPNSDVPDEEIESETGPKATEKWREGVVEYHVEDQHAGEILKRRYSHGNS